MTTKKNSPPPPPPFPRLKSYPCLSILRLASPPESHHQAAVNRLRQALLDHFHTDSNESAQESNDKAALTTTDPDAARQHHLHLSNRYFSAQVALYDVDTSDNNDKYYSILSDNKEDEFQFPQPWKEDGIVLVIGEQENHLQHEHHHHHPTDFETALEPLHQRAVANDRAGDLLRLCIVVTNTSKGDDDVDDSNNPEQQDPDFSQRVLWCLDRGYEYVGQVDLSSDGCLQGHDERDKSGFARIVEAIRGTVWSSAVMQTSTQQKLQNSYQQDKEALLMNTKKKKDGTSSDEQATPFTESSQANESLYVPPSMPLVDGGSPLQTLPLTPEQVQAQQEREEQARVVIWEQSNLHNSGDDHVTHPPAGSTLQQQQQQQQQNNQNDERYFDQLEHALLQAKQIRELSQSGQLSDEDRRQRAGDAAMLLMNLMNYHGGGGDGEDDDSLDENDGGDEDERPSPGTEETATTTTTTTTSSANNPSMAKVDPVG